MIKTASKEAFQLIHEGAKALSKVEHVGIRIDERRLQENIQEAAREIMERESKMKADPLWKRWKKRFGEGTKLGSREQLGTLLFEDMGYACPNRTATGRFKVDEAGNIPRRHQE
jgi:DNA polymerase I-like protein with 3'-5' exonuclease and polymerase domains